MLMPPQVLSPTQPLGGQQQPSQLAMALMNHAQMPQLVAPSFGSGMSPFMMAKLMQGQNPNGQPQPTPPTTPADIAAAGSSGGATGFSDTPLSSANVASDPSMLGQAGSWIRGLFGPSGGG